MFSFSTGLQNESTFVPTALSLRRRFRGAILLECIQRCALTHVVLEEEDATEEAEQVSSEQGQVDGGGAAQPYHDGHEAVQGEHTEGVGREQEP